MGEWKETEIGQIPIEWDVGEFDSICELLTDGSHYSPKYEQSSFYMASVKDMRYNYFDFSDCKTISKTDFDLLVNNNCSPRFGDIIISKDGANCLDLIFVYKQSDSIVVLSSIAIARLKKEYDPDFYRYYLLSPDAQYLMRNQFISGSAIPRVVLKDFKKIKIPLFDKNEQRAIASILSSLDDKIDLLHRQNKTLEQLAESLFRQWFVEEGIEIILIGNVASVTTGKGLKREEFIEDGEFPILGANGEIGRTNKYLTESKLILTGRVGTLGKVYLSDDKVWISDNVLIVNPSDEKFFYPIYFILKTIDFENLNVGSTQPLVTQTELKKIELKIPAKQQFEEFAKICSYNFEKIKTNQIQIHTLTQLRDTLLPKLMSGEVRVSL